MLFHFYTSGNCIENRCFFFFVFLTFISITKCVKSQSKYLPSEDMIFLAEVEFRNERMVCLL